MDRDKPRSTTITEQRSSRLIGRSSRSLARSNGIDPSPIDADVTKYLAVAERNDRRRLRRMRLARDWQGRAPRPVAPAADAGRMRDPDGRRAARSIGAASHRDVQQRLRQLLQPAQPASALLHAAEHPRRGAAAAE